MNNSCIRHFLYIYIYITKKIRKGIIYFYFECKTKYGGGEFVAQRGREGSCTETRK